MNAEYTTYDLFTSLDSLDKGWVVGMLEGEGTFTAHIKANNGGKQFILAMAVEATSIDYDVVERMHAFLGGKLYGPYQRGNKVNRPIWKWTIHKRHDVYELAKLLLPYMGVRRQEQVQKLIDAYENYARK